MFGSNIEEITVFPWHYKKIQILLKRLFVGELHNRDAYGYFKFFVNIILDVLDAASRNDSFF